jgi:two-component system chemotaxis response regulator CheV
MNIKYKRFDQNDIQGLQFASGQICRILPFDFTLEKLSNSDNELKKNIDKTIRLCLNIQKIREVISSSDANFFISAPCEYPIIGQLNLREDTIPIIDLEYYLKYGCHKKFNHNTANNSFFKNHNSQIQTFYTTHAKLPENSRIIICEFQKILLAFFVHKTFKIINLENQNIQNIWLSSTKDHIQLFNGTIKIQDEIRNQLDIEAILHSLNMQLTNDTNDNISNEPNILEKLSFLKVKTVLVVEDSIFFQKRIKEFFKPIFQKVITVNDGQEGLDILYHHINHKLELPTLIFTDIEMPKLNGIGMVRKIKEHDMLRNIPIIFNTSISTPGLIQDIQEEGLGHYIVKFSQDEIYKSLLHFFSKSYTS